MKLVAYRLKNEGFTDSTLELAPDLAAVESAVAKMNAGEKRAVDRHWTAETMAINLTDRLVLALAAQIAGARTSDAKRRSSRANGKLGGRPRRARSSSTD